MGDAADTEAACNIITTRLQTSNGVASCEGGYRLGKWGAGGRGFGKNADPFQDRHPGRQREPPKLVKLPKSERTASTPTRGEFAPLLRDVGTHPLSRHSSMFERSVSEIISPQSRRTLFQGGGGALNGDFEDEVRLATASGRLTLDDECTVSDTCMYAYCIHIHMYTCIHMYLFICVSMYVCMCVCVCACVWYYNNN
jgi:hypothetical protein